MCSVPHGRNCIRMMHRRHFAFVRCLRSDDSWHRRLVADVLGKGKTVVVSKAENEFKNI